MANIIEIVKNLPFSELGQAILMLLGAFSIIAKITPTQADDKIVSALLKVVNTLGLSK